MCNKDVTYKYKKKEIKDMKLFVYGTLMKPEVVRRLTGKTPNYEKAFLRGYRKYSTSYIPYIMKNENSKVEGLLITNLDEEDLKKIDRYEGEGYLYIREKAEVVTERSNEEAYVYVGKNMKKGSE